MVLEPAFDDGFLVVFELSDLWKLFENIVQFVILLLLAVLPFFIVGRDIVAPDRLIIFDYLFDFSLLLIGLLID